MEIYWLELFGVIVFAVSGALAGGRKRMDVFGVSVVAFVTAVGGGTLRDMVLGALPVFWVRDRTYVIVAIVAAVATFVGAGRARVPVRLLLVFDAFGLGLFTALGCQTAQGSLGTNAGGAAWVIVMLMGAVTGAAGGVVRDILCGEIPLILRREVYATASLLGGLAFAGLTAAWGEGLATLLGAMGVTIGVRLAAIRWRLSLPVFAEQPPRRY